MRTEAYVYILFRPNGVPCYVGKGHGERWMRRDRHKQNPHLASIIRLAGGDLPAVKVREGLTDADACMIERALIAAIGREADGGPLVNLTNGGDGTAGAKMSPEWRQHRSAKAKALWGDPGYRAVMLRSDRKRGGNTQPRTMEFKAAVAAKLVGNTHTLGLRHTDEARQKMRDRWKDPVWRAAEIARRRASGMYSSEAAKRRHARRAKV